MHDMAVAVLVCFGVWLNSVIIIYVKSSQAYSVHNIKQSSHLFENSRDFYSNGTNREQKKGFLLKIQSRFKKKSRQIHL